MRKESLKIKAIESTEADEPTGEADRECLPSAIYFKLMMGIDSNLRHHAFDVKVGEDNFNSFAHLAVEKVMALGVSWVEAGKVGTPESAVRRCGTVEAERTGHRRNLVAGRDAEIYFQQQDGKS